MSVSPPYTELCALSEKYGTDKRPEPKGHGYTHYYHSLFADRQDAVRKVLEIGIDVGASLRMWEEYFPAATIYALDADPARFINDGRIRSFQCDQSIDRQIRALYPELGTGFDLILDDGSHVPEHQVTSAVALLPLLAPWGIYVIEDVRYPWVVVPRLLSILSIERLYLPEVIEFDIRRDPYSRLVVIHAT